MRHIIRLWVYDRPGVLDRITGVIRRHGINIKTVTAGDTSDGVSQITVCLETKANIQNLCYHFSEMSSVHHWEECSPETHVTRELLLIRFTREQKTHIPEEARVFREEDLFCFAEYVAEPSDVDALARSLRQHDIACVRTGALGLSKLEGAI